MKTRYPENTCVDCGNTKTPLEFIYLGGTPPDPLCKECSAKYDHRDVRVASPCK